ncbi:exodeoxyribonuclease VII large subunit [Patescibacteria group bacterium]|nr:exodeoxyribonuclease VII large subunit [Patescibacteria group bacterium]
MKILQVSEFIEIINLVLRQAWKEEELAIEGEISGYRVSQGQWVTFDLKDDKSLVNVFMPVWNLHVPIEDGMKVRVIGMPRIYPKYGKFSFSAEHVELAGEGALKKALALLRQKLEKEGLFDPSRKRLLPRFPEKIALVASRDSAAYGDFVRILSERWGGLSVDLYHVLVQGDRAPQEIVSAIQSAQEEKYDVLIMTRGGGSMEDLMAFNDERVVRAIHASQIPTLVAIGHERDLTLAEEAADVRGSTPTDCARLLVPDRKDVQYELATLLSSIESGFESSINEKRALLNHAVTAPAFWLSTQRSTLENTTSVCVTAVQQWVSALHDRLRSNVRLLTSLDPKGVLSRGYAMVRDASGKSISSISQLQIGKPALLILQDGQADTQIISKCHSERNEESSY